MIQFDPLRRGESKFKRFIGRMFPKKEIIIRRDGTISHYTFSTAAQVFLFFVVIAFLGWLTVASLTYFTHEDVVRSQNDEIVEVKNAYAQVVSEIAVYKDYMQKVSDEIAKTYEGAISSVEKKLSAPEKEALMRNYKLKMAELDLIKNKINEFSESLELSSVTKNSDNYKIRDVMLEREVALEMKKELMHRNKLLEKALIEMRDANLQVFERVETLADNGVEKIEDMLDKVKGSLAKIGLDNKKLIRRAEKLEGKGGPFSPAPLPALPDEKLSEKFSEVNRKLEYWHGLSQVAEMLPLGNPVSKVRVTSPYGTRVDPFNGNPAMHKGIDFAGSLDTPLHVTAPGTVIRAGPRGDYGLAVEVDHGLGFTTLYAHLNKILVKSGDKLQAGDKVGLAGKTGRSTGVHLHYEIRHGGRPINPYNFVKARKNVLDEEG